MSQRPLSHHLLPQVWKLIMNQSIIKAAFNDSEKLRQAPYRIFRAIVPTETLIEDERQWRMLQMTTSKFAIFKKGKRTLSWSEGRE